MDIGFALATDRAVFIGSHLMSRLVSDRLEGWDAMSLLSIFIRNPIRRLLRLAMSTLLGATLREMSWVLATLTVLCSQRFWSICTIIMYPKS